MISEDNSTPHNLIQQANRLAKQGDTSGAMQCLREIIRSHRLTPDEIDRVGRLLSKWTSTFVDVPQIRVLMLGQCTTSWLATSLRAIAWGDFIDLPVRDGEYDNVIQELMLPENIDANPDVIVLVPWIQRSNFDNLRRSADQQVSDEVAFWQQAWAIIAKHYSAKVLQVGYDWVVSGPLGYHLSCRNGGEIDVIRRVNDAIRSSLPAGAFFVDLEQVSGAVGRSSFYDSRSYFWTKQPFSERGIVELARSLSAGIRAVTFGPKKVLVLDLDNTLWGGIVGETGPLGIALGESPDGEAFRAFQKYVKGLSLRGVLLAVASKNNREDALAPFLQNKEMVLAFENIAHFEAHWEPKDVSLRRIAESLRLGLDSFVFFDDNPAERELIRQSLPEVAVVDVPLDPADYIRALHDGLWFEAHAVLEADLQRTRQYQQEQQRRELLDHVGSLDDYLRSLDMQATVTPITDDNIQRVVQLLGKTNQFNLTTRRHSEADVRRLIESPDSIALALHLRDRFGDHGLVSVLIAIPDSHLETGTLRIDTWLMSCRVIGRTVETFLFNLLVKQASQNDWDSLHGEFIPTKKNALVADLFDRLGFERLPAAPDQSIRYRQSLKCARELPSCIHISGLGNA